MKKNVFFTLVCSLLFSITSFAQIKKGSVLLGGGISVSTGKSESGGTETKGHSFTFFPAAGLAVKENTVVGLRLSYYRSTNKQNDVNYPNKQEAESYSGGLFYRKYLGLSRKFFLFGEGAAYYLQNKQSTVNVGSNSTYTAKVAGIDFYPGVAFAATRRIHLEVGLNQLLNISYSSGETVNTSTLVTTRSKNSGFNFSTNVSTAAPLTVGFRFVLGK